MSYHTDETIAAIASAPGGAYRGIVRVGGNDVVACLSSVFASVGGDSLADITRATALAGHLRTADFAQPLPCTLYLWPTRRSFTRQPLAEVHTIGSPPLLDAVVDTVCQAGARLAEPGEFTLRAFLAGRIDLTQAEAVLGVIDARGRQQFENALEQLSGGLSGPLQQLRNDLVDLLAHLEAGLDFVEEDIEFISDEELLRQLAAAAVQVSELLEKMSSRGVSDHRTRVVLLGLPNAGKSSLLNALSGDAAAIVSPQQGTTRDYISSKTTCDGVECLLIDTAGAEDAAEAELRETASISSQAQQATGRQIRDADLRLLCIDAATSPSPEELERLAQFAQAADMVVSTKCDRPQVWHSAHVDRLRRARPQNRMQKPAIATSAVTGEGLDLLRREIARLARARHEETGNAVAATAARCRDSLQRVVDNLCQAQAAVREGLGEEIVAAEIRIALVELGKVVGTIYTDDILDRVFSRFCIGK